jgi:hypothetical protein
MVPHLVLLKSSLNILCFEQVVALTAEQLGVLQDNWSKGVLAGDLRLGCRGGVILRLAAARAVVTAKAPPVTGGVLGQADT